MGLTYSCIPISHGNCDLVWPLLTLYNEINIWYVLIPHQVTVRFLRDNPTETTLMLVKDEQHNNAQTTLPAWLTWVVTRTVSSASYRTLMPWLIICIRVWVRMPPVDCVCSGWCSLIWHQMTSSVTWSSATFRLLDEWDAMVIFRIWTYQWKFMSWANMILGELNSEKYSYCAMYIRNSFFCVVRSDSVWLNSIPVTKCLIELLGVNQVLFKRS